MEKGRDPTTENVAYHEYAAIRRAEQQMELIEKEEDEANAIGKLTNDESQAEESPVPGASSA